jgi:hypothetical protein
MVIRWATQCAPSVSAYVLFRSRHPAYRRGVTTTAGLQPERTTVVPGNAASIELTVHNNGDIVEGYQFEPVGPLAAWTHVRPDRLSLYPGTSETVTLNIRPPRSPEAPFGEVPIGCKVLPAEQPDNAVVPETTVLVAPFFELSATLVPRLRKRHRRARYTVELDDHGNAPLAVSVSASEAGEQLKFSKPSLHTLEAGKATSTDVVVRSRKLQWFGKPAQYPFQVAIETEKVAAEVPEPVDDVESRMPTRTLDGTFVQLPVLPRWLLAILAALLALLIWFAFLKPELQSEARQAVDQKVRETPALQQKPPPGGTAPPQNGQAPPPPGGSAPSQTGNPPPAAPPPPPTGAESGRGVQFATTPRTQSRTGSSASDSFVVPDNKLFRITDMIVSNFQGDQGLITISAGNDKIATIALETFRNQDYHWVTPIDIPQGAAIRIDVTCSQPGVFPNGQQAANCIEMLDTNGTLMDMPH